LQFTVFRDQTDPEADGIARGADFDGFAVEEDLAAVEAVGARPVVVQRPVQARRPGPLQEGTVPDRRLPVRGYVVEKAKTVVVA
jgi:hypothetical protein